MFGFDICIFKMAAVGEVRERVNFHRDVYAYLIKGLNKQRKAFEFCDVTLKINGSIHKAHRAVLAATSPYFRSMFTSKMKEETCDLIDLSRSLVLEKDESFKQILDFLYSGDIEVTTTNAEDILRLSDFLLLEDVKEYCRDFFLQHGNLNLKNCLYLSSLADHHNMPDVAEVARQMVIARFHDHLIFSDQILELPLELLFKLLRDPEVTQFTSPASILRGILRWIKHSYPDRRHFMQKLFLCVHFNLSTLSDLDLKLILDEERLLSDRELIQRFQRLDQYQGMEGALCKQALRSSLDLSPEREDEGVLVALSCNAALHHLSVVIFRLANQEWYKLPISYDSLHQCIPSRLNICAATYHKSVLYMFLSFSLPYPADMLRIHVLAYDLNARQHFPMTFRHRYNLMASCQTTLTDNRGLPPVLLFCHGCLCLVGNVEGCGHIFLCDLTSQTYMYYPIQGTRLVSQARGVVKDDTRLCLWLRHQLGHEEYSIKREVSFVIFNVKTKCFELEELQPPPGISYAEFCEPHVLCVEDGAVLVHTPGRPSLVLNEDGREWLTHPHGMPCFPGRRPCGALHCCAEGNMYIVQNPAAYTSSLWCLTSGQEAAMPLTPPPCDGLSVVVAAQVSRSLLQGLVPCFSFDETFTELNLNHTTEEEDWEAARTLSDSEVEEFEFDDDLFDYYAEF